MLNATWPITKLLCHDVLLRHVQVHLIFKSRKHIAASASSVKNFETPAVVTTRCELINLYFTLTQGGLISISFVSSLASAKKKTRSSWKICSVMFCLNDDHHLATSLKSRDHANIRCHLGRKSRHHANFALCGQTESTLSCFSKHLSIKRGDEGIFKCFRCVLWRKFLHSHSTYSFSFQPHTIR